MPKGGKSDSQESRKQQVRRAREEHQARVLYASLGTVALVIALVLGFGYYQENIAKWNAPIVKVNGVEIPVRTFQTDMRYQTGALNTQMNSLSQNMSQASSDPSMDFLQQYFQQQFQQL